jgi:hypothetical protein
MSLTPVIQAKQVYSDSVDPVTSGFTPAEPGTEAIFIVFNGGVPASQWYWNPAIGAWATSGSSLNFSLLEAFGWSGRHNNVERPAKPHHTQVARQCSCVLQFSVHEVSGSPIPFKIRDEFAGVVLASGAFPANAQTADAAACNLVDLSSVPVAAFPVVAGQVVQFSAVPDGGHAAMPSDGYGFQAQGYAVF